LKGAIAAVESNDVESMTMVFPQLVSFVGSIRDQTPGPETGAGEEERVGKGRGETLRSRRSESINVNRGRTCRP